MISPGGLVPLLADSGPFLWLPKEDRMPAERIVMRHVREVLRLKFVGGLPIREIARRIGVAASTVRATLARFHAAGLSWPLPEEMTDAMLEARLFANAGTRQGHRRHIEPDWAAIHRELKRKHVTLQIGTFGRHTSCTRGRKAVPRPGREPGALAAPTGSVWGRRENAAPRATARFRHQGDGESR